MSDVTVTITGALAGISVTQVQINYTINAIPTCEVTLNAADPTTQNIINNQDTYITRIDTTTINISVNPSNQNTTPQSVTFIGFFDGISFSMSYGDLSYSAIFKGVYQLMVEASTVIPGITAAGYNPFKLDLSQIATSSPADPIVSFFGKSGAAALNISGQPMTVAYYNALQAFASLQSTQLLNQLGNAQNSQTLKTSAYANLLLSGDRQTKMQNLQKYVSNVDISFLKNPAGVNIDLSQTTGRNILTQYLEGPSNMWENMVQFYSTQGCVVVASNNTCQILPNNGFIQFTTPTYSPKASGTQQGINIGLPADYNSVTHSKQGYADIGYAVVVNDSNVGSSILNASSYYGIYPAEGQPSFSPGGGILYLPGAIFKFATSDPSTNPQTHAPAATANTPGKSTNVPNITKQTSNTIVGSTTAQDAVTAVISSSSSAISSAASNYAQIKVYQSRYGDCTGSVNCWFQNNWCPGTVGAIYLKQQSGSDSGTGTYLNFFVTRVTHSISVGPPRSGSATTTVGFNCGRIGANSIAVDSDLLYGYNLGNVQSAQATFIGDIT